MSPRSAREDQENDDRARNRHHADQHSQPAHRAAQAPLVLPQALQVARAVVGEPHLLARPVRLHLQVEKQAAVERQEQVYHQQGPEQDARGADRSRHHQQQGENDELAEIAVGPLLVQLDQLQRHKELPDDHHRRPLASDAEGDVSGRQDHQQVRQDPRHRPEAATVHPGHVEQDQHH